MKISSHVVKPDVVEDVQCLLALIAELVLQLFSKGLEVDLLPGEDEEDWEPLGGREAGGAKVDDAVGADVFRRHLVHAALAVGGVAQNGEPVENQVTIQLSLVFLAQFLNHSYFPRNEQ